MEGTGAVLDVSADVTSAIVGTELDRQIRAAQVRPRVLSDFTRIVRAMVTLNETVAEDCMYALPRKDRDGQEVNIEGPSARFAEIVLSAWGNCRVGARVIEVGEHDVVAQGVFIDLERNVSVVKEVRRRITGRSGKRYSADMITVTANAACSIAARNVVLAGIPQVMWAEAYEEARKVAAGDAMTLATRRSKALDTLAKLGVQRDRVFTALGVAGVEDVTLEHLAKLRGIVAALRHGEATIEEAFPTTPAADHAAPPAKGVAGLKAVVVPPSTHVAEEAGTKVTTTVTTTADVPPPGEPVRLVDDMMCSSDNCTSQAEWTVDGLAYCVAHVPLTPGVQRLGVGHEETGTGGAAQPEGAGGEGVSPVAESDGAPSAAPGGTGGKRRRAAPDSAPGV